MKKLFFSACILAAGAFAFSSCLREESTDWTFAVDNAHAEESFQDIYKNANQVAEGGDTTGGRSGCTVITLAQPFGTFPNTYTIDFGTDCVCADGRTRSGQIVVNTTGHWRDAGTSSTVTLQSFVVNGYAVAGTTTITTNAANAAGNPSITVNVDGGQITNPQNETATWSATKTFEWVDGDATSFASHGSAGVTDDVFHITGSANGVSRGGQAFTATITSPLVRRADCRWITQGIADVTPTGGSARTIDFGDGSCDNQATLTFRRWSTTIQMH